MRELTKRLKWPKKNGDERKRCCPILGLSSDTIELFQQSFTNFYVSLFVSLQEYLKNKQQREEAIQKYKKKKMESFQILSKKTKKGQPNLNLQMEYLLQKIQGPGK